MFLKRMYSADLGWNVLYMPVLPIQSNVLFKAIVFLLICSPDDLSIDASEVLMSPLLTLLLSISLLFLLTLILCIYVFCVWCIDIYNCMSFLAVIPYGLMDFFNVTLEFLSLYFCI